MSNRDELTENQIRIELLDSGSGRVIQFWTFSRSDIISVGRSPENSVILQDPYVSRHHADLEFAQGRWRLTNRGRHGTVLDGIDIGDSSPLEGDACFQLGCLGPTLRVRQAQPKAFESDTTMISAPAGLPNGGLAIDHDRIRREVQMITETPYFRELQQVSRRIRAARA
jgi:pSer/pThr/pTyr-binding forkhead associated (FHA) protein